jgi:uncharacterized protein YegP (UPF0339 family)
MAAKFEISKDKSGKFRFHLKAANGEIIASGQGYKTKASAEKGIEAVKLSAQSSLPGVGFVAQPAAQRDAEQAAWVMAGFRVQL